MGQSVQKQEEQKTQVTPIEQRAAAVYKKLQTREENFEKALNGRIDTELFLTMVMKRWLDDERLQGATPISIYKAALDCAFTGLRPDGEEAALIAYGDEAQFQPGYIGYVRLILRAGAKKVEAHVVRTGDHFDYGFGLNPHLEHKPAPSDERGEVTHAYGIVWLANGETQFEVMDKAELDKIADFAKKKMRGKVSPARREWEEQMHRKAPLRRLRKFVELSPEASAAFRADELSVAKGIPVHLGDVDDRFETRALAQQARDHARRQTLELKAAMQAASGDEDETGGDGAGEAPEGAQGEIGTLSGGSEDSLFSLEEEATSGKHEGKTWAWILENDREYAERVIENGWILDDLGIERLKEALLALEQDDEEAPLTKDEVEELKDLLTKTAEVGLLDMQESEDFELAIHDENAEVVREGIELLRERLANAAEGEQGNLLDQ